MEKILPILLMGILVLNGLGAAAFQTTITLPQAANVTTLTTSVLFPTQPTIAEKDGFIEIRLDGATTFLSEQNRPVLPAFVKTYQIPFRSTGITVQCTVKEIGSIKLEKEIIPSRIVPLSMVHELTEYVKDPSVYESAALYPDSWFSFNLGAGRNEQGVQVTFVKVVCYPIRYSPLDKEITYAGGFDIVMNYNEPNTPQMTSVDEYDMVIIAPEKFQAALEPLVTHKNSKGVSTMFKSVEDILAQYEGFDPPEQIKYFIEHEYNLSNITYVTLVGGVKSHLYAEDKDTHSAGWNDWWVPVRYANIPQYDFHGDDEAVLCDLYYGCLYNGTGAFDSWDSNGDHVYAAWGISTVSRDQFDLNPEVYVSRIPCATVGEVKAVVKKIQTYESSGPEDKPWYKNFIGIGGKTFYMWLGKPDGEYTCDLTYNYTKNAIPDLKLTKCYASLRDVGGRTPKPKYIIKSFNEGAGFVIFQGHGSACVWNTIWHDGTYPEDWVGAFHIYYYPFLINGNKLPVVIVGGCHNGLYNLSLLTTLKDRMTNNSVHDNNYFCAPPAPYCFSAGLVLKPNGGAIASTGCTGYGLGAGAGDPVGSRSSALEANFFYEVGANVTHLAQAHGLAISKYLSEHVIVQVEAFCIVEWALFGDASLRFGGYSS